MFGARGETRTLMTLRSLPPQSSASTNSATRAFVVTTIPHILMFVNGHRRFGEFSFLLRKIHP